MFLVAGIAYGFGAKTFSSSVDVISFGLAGMPRARWVRVALLLALYGVLMPVIGLLAGESLSDRGASAATYLAGLGLIGAGVYGLFTIPNQDRRADPSQPVVRSEVRH